MENVELINDILSVRINFKGAELSSMYNIKDNIEHIWQADSKVWARNAPMLFPIVGKVRNGKYKVEGNEYLLGQHGFARDRMFELDELTKTKVVFKLCSDDESLKIYPFKFCLYVTYMLSDAKLDINYRVENTDSKDILFSIGAHPGFTVPFNSNHSFEDYFLEFDKAENADRLLLSEDGFLSGERVSSYLNNERVIALKYSTFSKDALIFENLKSSSITIKSNKTDVCLKVGIDKIPLLGLWTLPGANAPYICIEPWYGVADSVNSTGVLAEKKAIESLGVGEQFNMDFYMELL
ncbi:MAG: aldose 1-epimerase family protein [Flavobacteriales bacterium]|nr:aldose 1-epimerase family protein [Flavobacteriales bacterium]